MNRTSSQNWYQRPSIMLIFVIFILLDLTYSSCQYYAEPLDGDMAPIIVPSENYATILKDPFGISILSNGDQYPGSNRFFAHWTMERYFKIVPAFLQKFVSPLDSIYLASTLLKTSIHLLLLIMIAAYASYRNKLNRSTFLLAAVLITPLFQASIFNSFIGVVCSSITYNFFYSLPLGMLLVFAWPFFKTKHFHQLKISHSHKIFLIVLVLYLSFSSPLIGPIFFISIAIGLTLFIVNQLATDNRVQQFNKGNNFFGSLLLIGFLLLSIYAFYLGQFNAENSKATLSIVERYSRLGTGLYHQLTRKIVLPLLIGFIILNYVIIHKKIKASKVELHQLKFILAFCVFYLLLLPLGGYRDYRPNIISGDTFSPISIILIYLFGRSTITIIQNYPFQKKVIYPFFLVAFLAFFTIADEINFNKNECERNAIRQIQQSSQNIVKLNTNCNVFSWDKIEFPQRSKWNGKLLKLWNVLDEEKQYFHE